MRLPSPEREVVPRLATPEDNAALLSLSGEVPMSGELVLSTQRGPDFFALYAMQGGVAECWVADAPDGRLAGMGSLLVREGWMDGAPARVGYLGDLRTRFAAQRVRGLSRFYGQVFDAARVQHGSEVFLTAVLASNAAALQSLVRRSARRPDQPHYHLLRRFTLRSIQFTGKRRARPSPFRVRQATPADLPAVIALLDADHRQRPFGYRFDQGELQHRLAAWPGFTLAQTWLAHAADGTLVGVTSAWDPAPVKRYRVEAWRGALRWQRLAFNAAAHVLGRRPLPPAGSELRTLYLCNTSIAVEDPRVLEALLEAVHAHALPLGYHLLSAPVYEGDPLAPAFERFPTRGLDFHLYAVTAAAAPRTDFPPGRPGFEPALA